MAAQGARFVGYDAKEGVWRFEVEHFSRYGLQDSDDEGVAGGGAPGAPPRRGAGARGPPRAERAEDMEDGEGDADEDEDEDDEDEDEEEEEEEEEAMQERQAAPCPPLPAGWTVGRPAR